MPIVNGSESWDRWIKNPVPITMKFHFFSLNNTDYKSLDYIELEEKGPFVYDETRVKENIHRISDEFISYQEKRSYTHEPGKGRNENESITFINFPLLVSKSKYSLICLIFFDLGRFAKQNSFRY